MSEQDYWDKMPKVEKSEFQDQINDLFAAPKVEASKKETAKEEQPKANYRVKIPEPPEQTKQEQQASIKLAKEEMEMIRKSFLNFTDEVNDTVMYSYLYPYIEDLVERCKQLQILISDDIDKDKLTEYGLTDYEQMRKIRGTILSTISDKNKKD